MLKDFEEELNQLKDDSFAEIFRYNSEFNGSIYFYHKKVKELIQTYLEELSNDFKNKLEEEIESLKVSNIENRFEKGKIVGLNRALIYIAEVIKKHNIPTDQSLNR